MLIWITREVLSETARRCALHKYANQKTKLYEPICYIVQGFSKLFVKDVLQVISCANAPNMLVAGPNLDRTSTENVQIWPKAQMSRELRDGQKC